MDTTTLFHEDRDPQNNNAFLKVAYSDVICEPTAVGSPRCLHQFTKTIYEGTILGTYWVLTVVFGGLLSFSYGLVCGSLSFFMIWVASPFVRLFLIPLGLYGKIWKFFVECFYDPLYESCGRIFSNVNINFNTRAIEHV
ncbi:caveolin-1-like [Pocillopora damicornis]|uniref:caveolin-1-like n=1 Tax=Pocillopora damicornis TaxID=46731 RepID=UPI000F54C994|nr:caveolin-1-like [Pocillopora damicornis]